MYVTESGNGRLAGMHGGRHILSPSGVLTTEEGRDGKKKQAMERALEHGVADKHELDKRSSDSGVRQLGV